MFNLSLTACSFHLRKTNSRGNTKIFNLNMPLTLQKKMEQNVTFRIYQKYLFNFLRPMRVL